MASQKIKATTAETVKETKLRAVSVRTMLRGLVLNPPKTNSPLDRWRKLALDLAGELDSMAMYAQGYASALERHEEEKGTPLVRRQSARVRLEIEKVYDNYIDTMDEADQDRQAKLPRGPMMGG